jgi:hypothetical protein
VIKRVLNFGIFLFIVVIMIWVFILRPRFMAPAEAKKNSAIAPIPSLVIPGMPLTETVRKPCRYIGSWLTTTSKDQNFNTEFFDDGSYLAQSRHIGKGLWAVQGNNMVWLKEDGYGRLSITDFNAILLPTAESFLLEEKDKTFTKYELIELKKSSKCSKE